MFIIIIVWNRKSIYFVAEWYSAKFETAAANDNIDNREIVW